MWKNCTGIAGLILIVCLFFGYGNSLFAQKAETIDEIRTVRNTAKGLWGNSPKVELKFEKTIGSMESEDENVLFFLPLDVTVDNEGNLYVLDDGNFRVQKFDPSGKYLATFGRKGQGPGELLGVTSITIDNDCNLFVGDEQNRRIQIFSPDGKSKDTIPVKGAVGPLLLTRDQDILMELGRGNVAATLNETGDKPKAAPLFTEFTPEGDKKHSFGVPFEYNNDWANVLGNKFHFALDGDDNIYISFTNRNRIEKYNKDGKPVLRIERELNYKEILPPKNYNEIKSASGKNMNTNSMDNIPEFVDISSGIGIDKKGRIWVATANRLHEKNEKASRFLTVSFDNGTATVDGISVQGATDVIETDIFKLEIFAPTGELLGEIPLTHFCDGMRIFGNKLYIIDELRGMQIYEYTIVDL